MKAASIGKECEILRLLDVCVNIWKTYKSHLIVSELDSFASAWQA